jgi:hypothetical protein
MSETPKFLQGVYQFKGTGLDKPTSLNPKLSYTVPSDKRVRPLYIRAGNSSSEMMYLVLMRNDKPMRYCPIGAKNGFDVGFHVIEEVMGGTVLEVCFAAPDSVQGSVVVDVGFVET